MQDETYRRALQQEADYWGQEAQLAAAKGIPFSADMQRAERMQIFRGPGLPQLQSYDPDIERLMNGEWYERLFAAVNAVSRPADVLVLACGAGGLSLELARQGHRVEGIDISPKALLVAQRFADECRKREGAVDLVYRCADLNYIKLEPKRYDAIVAWDGLHHILRLYNLMKQISFALRSGGELIYSDSVGQPLLNRLIGGTIYFVLPTRVGYATKLRIAIQGLGAVQEQMSKRSPFEGAAEGNLYHLTQLRFEILEKQRHTGIGFRAAIAGDLKDGRFRYSFLKFMKRLDDCLVRYGWLRGDHLFLRARPKL
ncbi:class I SAM-dependent methyltransferase [candidate division KSB1 bacterium]|nr:class I SAM-dependent methyltransferase [candidate division KSB1 bacterium]